MENKEAIEWLKGCVVSYEVDNKGRPNGNITCDLTQEVLDMAISALEKQEADKCCETCKYKNRSAQEIPCCDCYMASCFEDCYEPYTEEDNE